MVDTINEFFFFSHSPDKVMYFSKPPFVFYDLAKMAIASTKAIAIIQELAL
ncbi:MAG: hypothetical protein AAGA60_23755 [Cyanobacteria bacterium P01_E01_bin.42]